MIKLFQYFVFHSVNLSRITKNLNSLTKFKKVKKNSIGYPSFFWWTAADLCMFRWIPECSREHLQYSKEFMATQNRTAMNLDFSTTFDVVKM